MINTVAPTFAIMATLEQDSAGQSFRLVLRDGKPFGRVYQKAGTCCLEFYSHPARRPITRHGLGEVYAALLNGDTE